jgi:L-aspartate semialdehyde sulfurtransferase ferredoxin
MPRKRVRVSMPEPLIPEPIIYRLVKDFQIVVNVRPSEGAAMSGALVLELDGEDDGIERGIAWLVEQGLKLDPVERDIVRP